jgi:iron complex outermembrane receptor protein
VLGFVNLGAAGDRPEGDPLRRADARDLLRHRNGVPNARYEAKTSADLAFTWSFDKARASRWAREHLQREAHEQDPNETDNGFIYDSVQFGLNGTQFFARLWKKF